MFHPNSKCVFRALSVYEGSQIFFLLLYCSFIDTRTFPIMDMCFQFVHIFVFFNPTMRRSSFSLQNSLTTLWVSCLQWFSRHEFLLKIAPKLFLIFFKFNLILQYQQDAIIAFRYFKVPVNVDSVTLKCFDKLFFSRCKDFLWYL